MPRLIKKRSTKAGLPPGTLIHVGEQKVEQVRVAVVDYDETHFQERELETVEECLPFKDQPAVTWINVDGLHKVEVLARLGDCLGLHSLVLEDILNTDQRPKMDDLGEYLFIVLKTFCPNDENDRSGELEPEQISLILGPNFVVSLQERRGDVFDPIRERIRNDIGRIRRMGADYLVYALLDAVVDGYFTVLEQVGETVEFLEEELVTNPTPETLQTIHSLKRQMIFLRKSVWPLREVIGALERGPSR